MSSPYDSDPWATDGPSDDPWAEEAAAGVSTAHLPRYDDAPPADPWAPVMSAAANLPDEAQTSTPSTPANSKERPVTNSSEAKITTTIKYGAGFDAPWTVFHSDSVEEAKATLNQAKELLELTAKVAKYAKTLDSGTAPAANRGNGGGGIGGAQRQQSSTPPGVEAKRCAHGDMKYLTGNGAKGPWAGHFCPLEKGDPDQCKPIFVKNR
ncbi:hypothetical protein AB0G06_43425 [Nonomuraea dietziae]|uniref:hypothetical protein n=1 Tax=Nonomuraea dietziae TaxID=65515 RepID=UPI0033F88633